MTLKNKERINDIIMKAEAVTQQVPDEKNRKAYLEKASVLSGIVKMLENLLGDEGFLETQECTRFIQNAEKQIMSIV